MLAYLRSPAFLALALVGADAASQALLHYLLGCCRQPFSFAQWLHSSLSGRMTMTLRLWHRPQMMTAVEITRTAGLERKAKRHGESEGHPVVTS